MAAAPVDAPAKPAVPGATPPRATQERGAQSGNAFLVVESNGIDPIPAAERRGRARDLGSLWAGAFVNYASVLTASLATSFFGLGVWDGLAATLIGTLGGAVLLGLLSQGGPRSGLPQIALTRAVFGAGGIRVAALLTLFLAVGWFAVDTVIAALAGVQLLKLAGLGDVAGRFAFPLLLVVAGASVVVAVLGHATIGRLAAWGAVAFGLLSAVMFAMLAPQFTWTARATVHGADYPAAFALGVMVCFALVASWYPFASDYSRYLPVSTPARGVTLWPMAGVVLPMVLLGLFGLLIPTIDPAMAADPNGGVLAIITAHAPAGIAALFLVFVVLGEVWANYFDVYTAGLVLLTLGLRFRRWQTALACGILGTALAGYAVVVSDFHTAYQSFLLLTYLWAPAWAAIALIGLLAHGGGRPRRAVVAWLLGTGVSLLFVNYPNLFAGIHAFNQPLIDGLHGADLSGLVSLATAAAAYALMVTVSRPAATVAP